MRCCKLLLAANPILNYAFCKADQTLLQKLKIISLDRDICSKISENEVIDMFMKPVIEQKCPLVIMKYLVSKLNFNQSHVCV